MFTSLYHRRAGVKHSAYTEEDVDCSIMNASASSCDVNRGDHASTGRNVRRAKMDIRTIPPPSGIGLGARRRTRDINRRAHDWTNDDDDDGHGGRPRLGTTTRI